MVIISAARQPDRAPPVRVILYGCEACRLASPAPRRPFRPLDQPQAQDDHRLPCRLKPNPP
jgi:hypothetical protein